MKSAFGGKLPPPNSLATLKEALSRIGIQIESSRLEPAYNAGRITQAPTMRVVVVRRRVRRKSGYNGVMLSFERAGPLRRDQAAGTPGGAPKLLPMARR